MGKFDILMIRRVDLLHEDQFKLQMTILIFRLYVAPNKNFDSPEQLCFWTKSILVFTKVISSPKDISVPISSLPAQNFDEKRHPTITVLTTDMSRLVYIFLLLMIKKTWYDTFFFKVAQISHIYTLISCMFIWCRRIL